MLNFNICNNMHTKEQAIVVGMSFRVLPRKELTKYTKHANRFWTSTLDIRCAIFTNISSTT